MSFLVLIIYDYFLVGLKRNANFTGTGIRRECQTLLMMSLNGLQGWPCLE